MKPRLMFNSLRLLVLFLSLTSTALACTTWYVDGMNGSDNNDCKSPQTACKTIGQAISLASSGDSIMVAAATYTENLTIGVSLKLIGSGAATSIIDGGGANTVVTISGGVVLLSGVTVRNGHITEGGGIYNSGTLTISNSTLSGNSADTRGGGIYNAGTLTINTSSVSGNSSGFHGGGIFSDGKLTINRSTFSGNSAITFGGAISNYGYGTINNSTISGNRAQSGGGIFNFVGLTINRSTFSGNSASDGGAISNDRGLTINNSTFSGNSASSGGAISNYKGLTINNSTISGNRAGSGGGIYNVRKRSSAVINNSTISGNRTGNGEGIYNNGGAATLQNSIVANSHKGGNCFGTVTSNGYNLSSDSSCNFNNIGDLNNTDPKLGKLGKHGGPTQTIPLLSGSPAIDAGNPNGCTDSKGHLLKTDQRGKPRPDKEDTGGCDMGAYERQKD
jgi:predicted outer membrane repeat protein